MEGGELLMTNEGPPSPEESTIPVGVSIFHKHAAKELRRCRAAPCGDGEALVAIKAVGVCATEPLLKRDVDVWSRNMVLNCDLFLFALYLVPAYEMWEQNVDYGQSKLTAAKDVELFDGTMGYYHSGLSRFPLVPGHEWAGEVLELGPRVPEHLRVGQRVVGEHCTGCEPIEEEISARCRICCRPGGLLRCPRRKETGFFGREGAFQTVLRFPARQLHVLPPETPWDLAVLAEPLATACKAVRLADLAKAARLQRAQALGAELARGEGGGEQTSFQMPSDL
ncbi:2-deoxy-scyllo-inosamine dehydrogenase (DOIA dehydrogenase) [Durusdinium trenchii]|uniref:2-deoxy-scyllo-inosamine dehydrogenase (DOIA dehydrogenase) n=1 Tax=Durusdinium trenchii TaxID=1381693 RepID=A0ABP0HRM6_9DINO